MNFRGMSEVIQKSLKHMKDNQISLNKIKDNLDNYDKTLKKYAKNVDSKFKKNI